MFITNVCNMYAGAYNFLLYDNLMVYTFHNCMYHITKHTYMSTKSLSTYVRKLMQRTYLIHLLLRQCIRNCYTSAILRMACWTLNARFINLPSFIFIPLLISVGLQGSMIIAAVSYFLCIVFLSKIRRWCPGIWMLKCRSVSHTNRNCL